MRVDLITWTGKDSPHGEWEGAHIMIFTKRTRVEMSSGALQEIREWDEARKTKELEYMARTIPSSWEFVDYHFLVSDLTRATTEQIHRTRTGSYAQQNLSVQDVKGWGYRTGDSIKNNPEALKKYQMAMQTIADVYDELNHGAGVVIQDSRALLPLGIHTGLNIKWNLRTICETFRKRASAERGHGEYQEIVAQMREAILTVHPWAHIFLDRAADVAAREAYELIKQIDDKALRMELAKRIDQIMTS